MYTPCAIPVSLSHCPPLGDVWCGLEVDTPEVVTVGDLRVSDVVTIEGPGGWPDPRTIVSVEHHRARPAGYSNLIGSAADGSGCSWGGIATTHRVTLVRRAVPPRCVPARLASRERG